MGSGGSGRIGIELYYTGAQELEDNPHRASSRPYLVTGVLAEWRIGRVHDVGEALRRDGGR